MNLDDLTRMDKAATPGPWAEYCESGDWWVAQADADGMPGTSVCDSSVDVWRRQEDTELMIAARNALPALLRTMKAAREWEEAHRLYVGLFEFSVDPGDVAAAEHRLNRAEEALRAALADLEHP